ncbi:hypothetical protein [Nocardioides sp. LS1]|uniref:hypothetical protein n=1 Tax=Nocardioides sp. LS1 TaxID=1027620 RepID=UPI000F6261A1|nr:hypothetical protein [Nocardioides sp. LS1]GCD89938.1 hypothetical protein NLS1_19440 [Nocardioides sp. LS1]
MKPTVGTTLFSFTDEWRSGELTLSEVLARVAGLGLGPDVELVGYQSFRGLPHPTTAEVERFHHDVERSGLRPTAFGVYVDRATPAGRWLTTEESAAQLTEQLHVAARLGFTSTRATLGMDLAVVERVVPVLEELGLVLTFEIQGPHTPDAPDVTTLIAWLESHPGSPVGLTFDSSVAMPDLPASYRRALPRLGATPDMEARLEEAWRSDGPPFQRLGRFLATLDRAEVSADLQEQLVTPFVRFGHGDLADWCHVLPWVRHAHAKFWDWEDVETQVLDPHRAFVAMLVGSGYAGSISSEFGGIAWLERDGLDVFDLTRQHVAFLRSAVASAQVVHCVARAERLGLRPSTYLELAGS